MIALSSIIFSQTFIVKHVMSRQKWLKTSKNAAYKSWILCYGWSYSNIVNALSALVDCWSSVFIRRIIFKFLNACPYDYTAFAVSGKMGFRWPV